MAVVNHDTKEVAFKIVYCGTPMGGKTTNLSYIHSRIDGPQRGDLVSLATSSDRTLFFDFLPIQTVVINGYLTRFMLYTVPGQIHYNATRQMVLKGVDGIIFVADSQTARMEENVASWHTLEHNLKENGTPVAQFPVVLQYNKRDLPEIAPVPYMDFMFNNGARTFPRFEASAATGQNIFTTLNSAAQEILQRFHRAAGSAPAPGLASSLPRAPAPAA